MGRTSKFSFPYPGRKHASKGKGAKIAAQNFVVSGHSAGYNTSKAQKILGTAGELNIDKPNREIEDSLSWRSFGRQSSGGMSVAISESTQADDLSFASNMGNWDGESDENLQTKPSSTLLGGRYQDEVSTDASSIRRKLQAEHSSSTLRSYYDRQNSPLSVSQQTSASSARDLALRKGLPPVASFPRSPLLQGDEFRSERPQTPASTVSQSSKKKPARLDLTKLFPKPQNEGSVVLGKEYITRSPSVCSLESSSTHCEGLRKTDYRSKISTKPTKKQEIAASRRHRKGHLSNVYEDQESLARIRPIPERTSSRQNLRQHARDRSSKPQSQVNKLHKGADSGEQFSWENVRTSRGSPPWETGSFTSNSSLNTKVSRPSIMSNSDLRTQSVLSVSSDEDSGEKFLGSGSKNPRELAYQLNHKTSRGSRVADRPATNPSSKVRTPTSPLVQDDNFLTIPPPRLAGSRLSGPWNLKQKRQSTVSSRYDSASVASAESDKPDSEKAHNSKEDSRSSRLMTVTKQEAALVEALRLKKAQIRNAIIAQHEHETKSHPRKAPPSRHRDSNCSELTIRGDNRNKTQSVLLYLDAPVSFHGIDTDEPSPDLSDFLSFGSDEGDDTTPRMSWISTKGRLRADSITGPESENRDSPKTPQSGARLSAVGTSGIVGGDPRCQIGKGFAILDSVNGEFLDDVDRHAIWGL